MGFTTIIFLLYFLPPVLAAYYIVPGKFKVPLLLAVSYIFYLWGSPTGAAVLLAATVFDYIFGKAIHGAKKQRAKKLLLGISVTVNILILVYFKYMNFFVGEVNRLLGSLDLSAIPWTAVVFPVGISFITFHKISYLVDIYYGWVRPAESFTTYAVYLAMFPKLTQGPITRYHDISEQLTIPRYTFDDIFEGSIRFCTGLAKKVLLSNPMGSIADTVYSMDIASLPVGYAWLGVFCYSFQIYLDFSGYSDMAIGLGRMMGFTISENFNRPYNVENFTEHWKRWHISMVNWFREYLYIPLGGNRVGKLKTYRNLWLVFILSGFWHGANWTYLAWGIYNGLFMFLDRIFLIKLMKRVPVVLKVAQFYILLVIGHVFFRSETIASAFRYIHRLFDVTAIGEVKTTILLSNLVGNREIFVMAICFLICFFPEKTYERLRAMMTARISQAGITRLKIAAACILFLLSLISLINNSFSPFIYFRF